MLSHWYHFIRSWLCGMKTFNPYPLRIDEELMEELNKKGIILKEKDLRKWEWGLEYPNLDIIYKLSEIYQIPSAKILHIKEQTLKEGIEGIHKWIIRWLSYLIGFSIYGTIWFCRVLLFVILVIVTMWFYSVAFSV